MDLTWSEGHGKVGNALVTAAMLLKKFGLFQTLERKMKTAKAKGTLAENERN